MIYRTVDVEVEILNSIIDADAEIAGNIIDGEAEFYTTIAHADVPTYDGPYEFTPGEETQIAPTAHKVLVENIVINPVPDNYARMAWNGHTILFY